MALFVKIVDDNGSPDAVSSLADVIIDAVLAKGVGMFRGETHVAKDIRAAINETIRTGIVSVIPPVLQVCPNCKKAVSIWHTFADGTVLCTGCKVNEQ